MSSSIRLRTKLRDGIATVSTIIRHPMETGFRIDPESGEKIPAHYIKHITVLHNNNAVLSCDWSRAVAKNPYLSFMFEGARAGDTLSLSWVDNAGQTDSVETRM